MKKIIYFIFLINLISIITIAQIPKIQWQKCLGGSDSETAHSIQQTLDGGFIIAGHTNSNDGDVSGNHGGYDIWIVKLETTGSIQWQKCLGGTNNDYALSIQQTLEGGFIVAGQTNSNDGDVSGNHGDYDFWIVKLETTGSIQWQKCFGGSSLDGVNSIHQTHDSGYIVAGYTASNDGDVSGNHDSFDFWIVKLDINGELQWQKCLGGTYDDIAQSIKQTLDGGYIVVGFTQSDDGHVTGNKGYYDYWIVKLDSIGSIQWQKCLGGNIIEYAYSVEETYDGCYIISGTASSYDGDVIGFHGAFDYWIVKLDATGNIKWQKCFGGSRFDVAYSINQTLNGGYIISGVTDSQDGDVVGNHSNDDYWIIKLDSIGNMNWQKCLGGTNDERALSINQTFDGGYIIAGYTESNDYDISGNHGGYDYWIVKLDNPPEIYQQSNDTSLCENFILHQLYVKARNGSSFTYQWYLDGNILKDKVNSICSIVFKASQEGIYSCIVTNDFGYTDTAYINIEIYPIPEKFIIDGATETFKNKPEMYSAPYSIDYAYTWDVTNGTITNKISNDSIAVTWLSEGIGHVYAFTTDNYGCSSDTVDLEISIGMEGINSFESSGLKIYPNPFSNKTVIEFVNHNNVKFTLTILDITGQIIREINYIKSDEIVIEGGNLKSGLYIVELRGEKVFRGKLVVE